MSFFVRNNSGKQKPKKKLVKNRKQAGEANKKARLKKQSNDDDEVLSDEIDSGREDDQNIDADERQSFKKKRAKASEEDVDDDSDNELETPQEKKIRLAKKYLSELGDKFVDHKREEEEEDEEDGEGHQSNLISAHLKDSVLEKAGQLHRKVADGFSEDWLSSSDSRTVVILKNGHRQPITCCVVSSDARFVFTASKDATILKWCRETGRRLRTIYGDHRATAETFRGHTGRINALAISSDGKFLASGCVNKLIHIWKPEDMSHVHTFRGHRGEITGLAFRKSFHQLFSCSEDRMVKVWNLDEMSYVESLFGHHDTITCIDSFVRERAITAGGRDGTIRLWKIPEESHLIYLTKGEATIDLVRFVDEGHFLSADDNGTIALWALQKKKPSARVAEAHGRDNWITAIASLRNTDLFASGSNNGKIIFWKIDNDFRSIQSKFEYQVTGFVNSLEFTPDGRYLVAAISQEHRLGRWWRMKEARNVVHVIPLKGII